jgi:NRAMP (natural resistance-associated macrophage protein)-like metal ion transporter
MTSVSAKRAGKSKEEERGNPIKRFFSILGPGLITGASDDDPSGIGTYAQAGAQFGYGMLWTSVLTLPLSAAIQYICAKIALVTGKGLAGVLRKHYPPFIAYIAVTLLAIANTINAGTDIGAIGAATHLIFPQFPTTAVLIAVPLAILAVQVLGSYHLIAKIFKWLTLALFAYIATAFFVQLDMQKVLTNTFVPQIKLDSSHLAMLVALLGTTISPYLFFWQADQEVEEEKARGKRQLWQRQGASDRELKYAGIDCFTGIFFSNAVMYFIMLTTSATLHATGKTDIDSAATAASALKPLAGDAASLLFALGIIGSGFLAVPILTGAAAFAISEVMGWRAGLDEKPKRAKNFYIAIAVSTLIGAGINFLGINPMKALYWTALLNGLLAPPLLLIIMLVANNKEIMGKRTGNLGTNILGWSTTALMFAAALALIYFEWFAKAG